VREPLSSLGAEGLTSAPLLKSVPSRSGKPRHYLVREQFQLADYLILLQVSQANLQAGFHRKARATIANSVGRKGRKQSPAIV
jgi:hypothetical protein